MSCGSVLVPATLLLTDLGHAYGDRAGGVCTNGTLVDIPFVWNAATSSWRYQFNVETQSCFNITRTDANLTYAMTCLNSTTIRITKMSTVCCNCLNPPGAGQEPVAFSRTFDVTSFSCSPFLVTYSASETVSCATGTVTYSHDITIREP